MPRVDPADEQRHIPAPEASGAGTLWNESYYLDWFAPDGSAGGYIRLGFVPHTGATWYWACLVEPGERLVTVIDHEVPLPRSGASLEIRHDGLWADHHIADPLRRMTCDLESFALRLDNPGDVYRGGRGERVPFGLALEWETDRAAYQWPPITPRYEIPCRVQGEILVGDRTLRVDGWGQRDHSWGAARDWWSLPWCWSAGRLQDGTRFHAAGAFAPGVDFGVAYVLPAEESTFVEGQALVVETRPGEEGLAEWARLTFAGLDLTVTPLAWSPVLLVHPTDGRQDRFPRALARFDEAGGRSGFGWIEWNQPPIP